ncbi:MAG: cysteine/glutathione ABC transporter ATP-binding protein/permease CydC [Psittacicella sp.]
MLSILKFFKLYRSSIFSLILGILLMITGTIASIGLLSLSGWFLASTFLAGGLITFNFFYPSAGVRGFAMARTAARYAEKIITHDTTFNILSEIRVYIFSKLIPISQDVLRSYHTSELLHYLTTDIDTLDELYLNLLAPIITSIIINAIVFFTLYLIDPLEAYTICLIIWVSIFIIPIIFYNLGKRNGANLVESKSKYRKSLINTLDHQAEITLFGKEEEFKEEILKSSLEMEKLQAKKENLSNLSNATIMIINGLILVSSIIVALFHNFEKDGMYGYAQIAFIIFMALSSFELLSPIQSAFLHLGEIATSADRLQDLINKDSSISYGDMSKSDNFDIKIQDLNFSYESSDQGVFNINLDIKEGQKLAILGKTGSGKSTFIDLLTKNLRPDSGNILIDSKNIDNYTSYDFFDYLNILRQEVYIFNMTLRDNLKIANKDSSDNRLIQILKDLELSHLLEEEGLDIWIGDGGRVLSGGEKRRIGIARVLLRNSPVVILDEPTESLDYIIEAKIIDLLFKHCKDKTLIIITHRLSYLDKFDRVITFDSGKVIEDQYI